MKDETIKKDVFVLSFILLSFIFLLAACSPLEQPLATHWPEASELTPEMFITNDGAELPYRSWLPKRKPRAVIIALHGFNDYSNAFAMPALFFRAHSVATYAYDQRGFGEAPSPGIWGGTANLANDLKQFVSVIAKKHPKTPLYILGESAGGAVAIVALAEHDMPEVKGLILSAPAVWGGETMSLLYRSTLWALAHTVPYAAFTGSDLKVLASNNIPMLRKLSVDPLVIKKTRADAIYGLVGLMDRAYEKAPQVDVPALVLYGSCDEVIPPQPVSRIMGRLPAAQSAYYPGGYHMLLRDLQGDEIAADIVSWIANPNRSFPSGFGGQPIPSENSLDRKSCRELIHKISGSRNRDEKGTE